MTSSQDVDGITVLWDVRDCCRVVPLLGYDMLTGCRWHNCAMGYRGAVGFFPC